MTDTRIRDQFGFTPTEEFYRFWEFAQATKPEEPHTAFYDLASIYLTGPFDVLSGRFDKETANFDPCLHFRYFADPPEFVTVLNGNDEGLHWGYVIDHQPNLPLGITEYHAYDVGDDIRLFQESANLFDVLWNQLASNLEDMQLEGYQNPEIYKDEDACNYVDALQQLMESINDFHAKHKVPVPDLEELEFVDHCNPPAPFQWPDPEELGLLPERVASGIERLTDDGVSDANARLRIGRLLWHWHDNGSPLIEELAFELLDTAYTALDHPFSRHVLHQHRQHRHRKKLDVFMN